MKSLVKMSGAGNTFLFGKKSDWQNVLNLPEARRSQFIQNVCSQKAGFSTDGFVLLEPEAQGYRWDFYNSDGSPAEMCGNAARCAALFVKTYYAKDTEDFNLTTTAGQIRIKFLDQEMIQVQMPKVNLPEMSWEIDDNGTHRIFYLTNTGVPHAVLEIPQIAQAQQLENLAKTVRSHTFFRPSGTNVTFYSQKSQDSIEAVTFERGVEGFTQACGTGAVAAARAFKKKSGKNKVQVIMPGGPLFVELDGKNSLMSGGAKIIEEVRPQEEV